MNKHERIESSSIDNLPHDKWGLAQSDCRNNENRYHGADDYEQRRGKPAVEVWDDDAQQSEE